MQAVPALLTNSTEEFINQFTSFVPYFKRFSIDVIDGQFANNVTLQIPQLLDLIAHKKITVPTGVIFDFDLMVNDFERRLNDIQALTRFVTVENVVIYTKPLAHRPIPYRENFNIGLSITPSDDISEMNHYNNLNEISVIQIMTINPGFQGQAFIQKELDKIDQLRLRGYRHKIFLDGGINDTTIPIICSKQYQPDFLCMGSFLTKAPDIKQRVQYLHSMLG